jgi:hypothetical protein
LIRHVNSLALPYLHAGRPHEAWGAELCARLVRMRGAALGALRRRCVAFSSSLSISVGGR